MPDPFEQPDRANMSKAFWPLAIGFLTGAGVLGFLFFEAMGGREEAGLARDQLQRGAM